MQHIWYRFIWLDILLFIGQPAIMHALRWSQSRLKWDIKDAQKMTESIKKPVRLQATRVLAPEAGDWS